MRIILLLVTIVALSGCVAVYQKPIKMEKNYLSSGSKKIGVIFTKLPKPDVHLPGAGCLLCIAVAEANHSSLSAHVDTLSTDDFNTVKKQLLTKLRGKGLNVVELDEKIDLSELPDFDPLKEGFSEKDYRGFRNKYGVNHVLAVQINSIGMERKYSSYIPVADPSAVVLGVSYLVDLKDNSYKWYKHIKVHKSASGSWDEPPAFPALTNAFYQAIESGKEVILSDL